MDLRTRSTIGVNQTHRPRDAGAGHRRESTPNASVGARSHEPDEERNDY